MIEGEGLARGLGVSGWVMSRVDPESVPVSSILEDSTH